MSALHASYPSRSVGAPRQVRALAAPLALNFTVEPQGSMKNWCWAAVSASVSRYFPNPPGRSMCQVASMEVGQQLNVDCCLSAHTCDVPWKLELPLQHLGHFRQRAGGWLRSDLVAAELRAGNPLPIAVQWQNRGFHFLAIYGMQDVGNGVTMLWLTDPIFGAGSIAHDALVNGAYQTAGGHWSDSYAVQP